MTTEETCLPCSDYFCYKPNSITLASSELASVMEFGFMQTIFSVYSTNYSRRTVVGITLNAIPLDVG